MVMETKNLALFKLGLFLRRCELMQVQLKLVLVQIF